MRRFLLIALCLPAIAAAQTGVRFDQYNMTSASNIPYGAQAPIYTLPSSTVTVCAYPDDGGQPCGNTIPIYSDPALTQTADNPVTADVHGRFGFWLAQGTYTYSVVTQGGQFVGTYIFTIGDGGVTSVTFETNGVNNAAQSYLDLVAGANMTLTNTSGGHVRFDADGIKPQVVPPVTGQYVVIYPTSLNWTSVRSTVTPATPSTGGGATVFFHNGCSGLADCTADLTWSGFSLPSYVTAGSVTAIYPFAIYSSQTAGFSNSVITLPSATLGNFANSVFPLGQTTGTTGMTGAQVATASLEWQLQTTCCMSADALLNVEAVGLIVYYTGPAPPANTDWLCVPPLYCNIGTKQLGVDPLAFVSGGSMVYPGAGIPNSTGSAWGTSYGVSGTGNVALTASPTFTGTVTAAAITATNLTDSALTSTKILKASTGGLLANSGITDQGTLITLGEEVIFSSTTPTLTSCTGGSIAGNQNAFHISGLSSTTTCTVTLSGSANGVCTANAWGSGGTPFLVAPVSSSASVVLGFSTSVTDINVICF